MFKQVFDYSGNPYILRTDSNNEVLESEKERYNLYKYTDIMPPANLYPPRYFNGIEWSGSTQDEYEENNKPPAVVPDEIQMVIANLQMQVIQSEAKVTALENKYDELKTIVNDIKGSAE